MAGRRRRQRHEHYSLPADDTKRRGTPRRHRGRAAGAAVAQVHRGAPSVSAPSITFSAPGAVRADVPDARGTGARRARCRALLVGDRCRDRRPGARPIRSFISEAASVLSSSLNRATIVNRLVQASVDRFCDLCAFYAFDVTTATLDASVEARRRRRHHG